jgi:hypothetical protein
MESNMNKMKHMTMVVMALTMITVSVAQADSGLLANHQV